MDWLHALQHLRANRIAGVLITISDVRGHAPRNAGAKLVVTGSETWGSIGGGNLEEVAVRRARGLIAAGPMERPGLITEQHDLSDRVPVEHGVQCCGGRVTLLYEPQPVWPSIAVFGMGHVGFELALLLSRHDLELHLVDARPDRLMGDRVAALLSGPADVHLHHVPVLPELVVGELPLGTHALVLTHDHAEDLALVDALLRSEIPGSIGLIGSAAKWVRFRDRLAGLGHPPERIARVRTPIGDPAATGLRGKEPAVIALSVAVQLLAEVGHTAFPEIGQ